MKILGLLTLNMGEKIPLHKVVGGEEISTALKPILPLEDIEQSVGRKEGSPLVPGGVGRPGCQGSPV